jgi:hypothetical protein
MKRLALLLLLVLVGCTSPAPEMHVIVRLSGDNRSVAIAGFDKAIIDDIGRDTAASAWRSLLPIYKMPTDTDMKDFQEVQPGKYVVRDSLVVFTPDTAFKKGQTYFLRYFDYQGIKHAWQIIDEKKRLGAAKHRDVVFSY